MTTPAQRSALSGSARIRIYDINVGPAVLGFGMVIASAHRCWCCTVVLERRTTTCFRRCCVSGATRRELVFYDQRGGGRSQTDDRTPITWRSHVSDLALLVAELGLAKSPLEIVGYSWGGLLALLYAIGRVRRASTPIADQIGAGRPRAGHARVPAGVRGRVREAPAGRRRAAAARRARGVGAERARSRRLPSEGVRAQRRRIFCRPRGGAPPDPVPRRRPCPAVGVGESWGFRFAQTRGNRRDCIAQRWSCTDVEDPIPLDSSAAVARSLDARLIVLEACGHVPYVEQPDSLFAAIDEFLA